MTAVLYDAPGPLARRRNLLLGVVGTALLAAAVGFVIYRFVVTGQFDAGMWEWIQFKNIQLLLLDGLLNTLRAFALAAVLSLVLGAVFAAGRLSDHAWVSRPATAVVEFFRAVPLLILIFILYFGVSRGLGINVSAFTALVLGLMLYNGSVLAEVFRAGVVSLPRGQREAAFALGMRKTQVMTNVLLPQALRIMLPAILSQLVVVLKDTALGFVIGYEELLVKGQEVARDPSFRLPYIPVAIVIGAVYIVLCSLLSWLAVYVERRTGSRRRPRRAFDTGVGEPVPGDAVLELPV
jgi:glutamate transport system permease protein